MKRVVSLMLLAILACTPVHAAKRDRDRDRDRDRNSDRAASVAELRKQVETLKGDLNGSSWEILLSQGAKGKETKDVLIFQNNQVSLKEFSSRGFKPTNYTITPPPVEGGTAIWETMQTSDKEGLLFIRGEWKEKDQLMRGVLSHQKEGNPAQDYNFSSQVKVTIEPASGEPSEKTPAEASAKATETSDEQVLVSKEAE